MKRVTIGLILLGAAGLSQSGCGSACDRADDRIIKHYEDCKISVLDCSDKKGDAEPCADASECCSARCEVPASGGAAVCVGGGSAGNATCSSADAAYLECRATCVEAATCEALNGADFEGAADFGKCNADCEK